MTRASSRQLKREALAVALIEARMSGVPADYLHTMCNTRTVSWANVQRIKNAVDEYHSWRAYTAHLAKQKASSPSEMWSQEVAKRFQNNRLLDIPTKELPCQQHPSKSTTPTSN